MYPKIYLKQGKDASVKRGHPWIFSGAIKEVPTITDGRAVHVYNNKGQELGTGQFQNGSIAIRMLTNDIREIDLEFYQERLVKALERRRISGYYPLDDQNSAFRLVHAEGDDLPGLIIDIYNDIAVIQPHSVGMYSDLSPISKALDAIFQNNLETIYYRTPVQDGQNGYLKGSQTQTKILENGLIFGIDIVAGQKTGFFLDQRDNRLLVGFYSKGKKVLNAFSYTGGFTLYAIRAGALVVDSVDISKSAIEQLESNVHLNFDSSTFKAHHYAEDVINYLKNSDQVYDLMIVDPPAYAKNLRKKHNAVQGYKRLNALAMKKIARNGCLFTFSCSQVIDSQLFLDTLVAAGMESGRKIKVLRKLSQPADHPVNLYHPEGSYLKGFLLLVE